MFWTSAFGVATAPVPDPDQLDISKTLIYEDMSDEPDDFFIKTDNTLVIPEGYYLRAMNWGMITHGPSIDETIFFQIAGETWQVTDWYRVDGGSIIFHHKIITGNVGMNIWGADDSNKNLALSYVATCQQSAEAYYQWQSQIFDLVMEAYQQQLDAYERAKGFAEADIQSGVQGNAPTVNRQIEKNELKKGCIELMMGNKLPQVFAASIARTSTVNAKAENATLKKNGVIH